MIGTVRVAPPPRYTRIAIALHWLSALAVLGLIAIGLAMTHGTWRRCAGSSSTSGTSRSASRCWP
jgi:cytochrome b subunit of formate dehydrogenase